MTIETGDSVSLECVGTFPDGTVFNTSRRDVAEAEGLAEAQPDYNYELLTVGVGAGAVIRGLDEVLVDISVGDEESIEIPLEKAYGEYDEDLVHEHKTGQLHKVLGNEPGGGLYTQTQQGGLGEIVHTDDDMIRIDFNHELTGETLIFNVEILDAN